MTFKLRQIDYTADGRRLARDRLIESNRLTVGRASESDIHLPDLAVEPAHATITASGTRLKVQSVGTLGFTVDGKPARQAEINATSGAELGFGSTKLTVSLDSDGVVLIEIEGESRGQEKPDPAADKKGFALGAVMPSKRGIGWLLLTLILAVFLVLPIATHMSRASGQDTPITANTKGHVIGDKAWNPGELSLAHHMLSNHCEACHTKPFQPVRSETCMACHKDTHDHAPLDRVALARAPADGGARVLQAVAHTFGKEGPGGCIDCHVEHQGMKAMDSPRQQFCADCHSGLSQRLADTKLGNAGDFGTQHPEFRAWVVSNAETRARTPVSLADQPHEDNGLTFSHRIHLNAEGGVAKMAMTLGAAQGYGHALGCADCHQRSSDGVRFEPVNMERNCEACHSLVYSRVGGTYLRLRHGDIPQMLAQLSMVSPVLPPTQTILTGRARPGDFGTANYANGGVYHANFAPSGIAGQAMAPNGICGECHKPEMRGGKLSVRPVTMVSRYMPDGWFDHSAHRQTHCSECHAAANSNSAADVLLPRVSECRSCHLGEAAAKPKVPSSCAMCHSYHKTTLAPAFAVNARRHEDWSRPN